jgi:hypothetical protein
MRKYPKNGKIPKSGLKNVHNKKRDAINMNATYINFECIHACSISCFHYGKFLNAFSNIFRIY